MSDGVVKGPYSKEDWKTMLALKRSVNYLTSRPESEARRFTIKNDTKTLKGYLLREEAA